jgi:putative transposase
MARPLRIEFSDACYHVTARGNQRQKIFLDPADRTEWLDIAGQIAERFHWRIYAYCQMGNHFHLVAQTPEPNLARCMRQLNGVYTQRFNRQHHRCGHLLQGRYHAVIVDEESYLLDVCRYVLLNPVRAGLVRHAANWRWSSYRATAGQTAAPEWLAASHLLRHFSTNAAEAIHEFRGFVDAGLSARSPWEALRQEIYLGDEHFIELTQARMAEARRRDTEIPRPQRLAVPTSLDALFTDADDIPTAVIAAYRSGQFAMRQIADHLGVHYSTISRLLARIEMLDCVSSSTHSRLYVPPSQNRTWSVTPSGSQWESFAMIIEHARCADGGAIVAASRDTAAS